MYQQILVPVDFSEHASSALGHAALMARLTGGQLELVHVVEQAVLSHPSFWSAEPALADELHSQALGTARELIDRFIQEQSSTLGPGVSGRVVSGSVPGALVDYASESGAGLIVVSTHGRTGFARWLMGSVSERLLRVAPCSVLVVRGGRPGKAPEIRRILCAVDLSEHSRRALEVAAQLAHGLGASLEALHAWAVPFHVDAGASRDGLLDRMRDNAHAELDAFIARASLPSGVELSTSVVSGPPTAAITEHVASSHPDLLVLGTHGYGGVKRMVLGSVAEALARYSSCATLVVR
jgi:nucleotide-binding universal stress UspA family protein